MKIYVSTKITTVVQAASLLTGTVARFTESVGGATEHWVAVKTEEGTWARTDVGDGLPIMSDGSMIGWTALVPISMEDLIRDTVAETLAEQARQKAEADRKRQEFDDEVRRRLEEKYMGDAFKRVNGFVGHGEA